MSVRATASKSGDGAPSYDRSGKQSMGLSLSISEGHEARPCAYGYGFLGVRVEQVKYHEISNSEKFEVSSIHVFALSRVDDLAH